jgi:transposase
MPKHHDYTLSAEQLSEIEQAMTSDPRAEVIRRATAIRALHLGQKPEQIAAVLKVNRSTIYAWFQQWRERGIEGLVNQPRSGRPAKASGSYQTILETSLSQTPADYGYAFAIWTLDRLVQHMEAQTGIRISPGRLQVWLKRLGYVYRRPKKDLQHKQDPQARAEMQHWLEEIKKTQVRAISNSSLWMKQP